MLELREYQRAARDAVLSEWENGRRKTLLCLPTGAGKTIVFSSIAEHCVNKGERVLIIAHREELLEQARDKLKAACGLDSVFERGSEHSLGSPFAVTIASVQTISKPKRLLAFPPDYFGTVIVDEAHHCPANGYKAVLEHFNGAKVLGVTATPDRGDMKNLGELFDSCAYEYPLAAAIRDGYLCNIKAMMIPLDIDISRVSLSKGDLCEEELGSALDPMLEQIADRIKEFCSGRKTVIFLPLVSTSVKLAEMLNKRGLKAVEVDGRSTNRSEILSGFESGKYDIICNSMLLTEGWDCPCTDCVVVLRPTKIRSLYMQMVGRGTRIFPGKDNLLLLDFLWNTHRHDLCKPASLISRDENINKRISAAISGSSSPLDLSDEAEKAERDTVMERENSLASALAQMRKKASKSVDPIQFALSISSEDLVCYIPTFAWEFKAPTESQTAYLKNSGIECTAEMNRGMASLIISKLKNRRELGLSTPKQILLLERYGYTHVGEWSKEKAHETICLLEKNGWCRID